MVLFGLCVDCGCWLLFKLSGLLLLIGVCRWSVVVASCLLLCVVLFLVAGCGVLLVVGCWWIVARRVLCALFVV